MAKTVNLYEAKTQLSQLVERAAKGEEIVIAKAGKPKARLVAIAEPKPRRVPGLGKGKIWIAENFDADLPEELLRLFEGDDPDDPLVNPPPVPKRRAGLV